MVKKVIIDESENAIKYIEKREITDDYLDAVLLRLRYYRRHHVWGN